MTSHGPYPPTAWGCAFGTTLDRNQAIRLGSARASRAGRGALAPAAARNRELHGNHPTHVILAARACREATHLTRSSVFPSAAREARAFPKRRACYPAWIALVLWITILTAWAQPQGHQDAGLVNRAIDRGLAFLARDAVAWKAEHNCSSCHHAALVVWAMNEAKRRDHPPDETVLKDLTKWLTEAGEGKTSLKRPAEVPKAFNTKALYYALGLGSVTNRSEVEQEALNLLLRTVREDQTENGSWASWPETRPPLFGHSDDTVTALATLALMPAAAAGDALAKAAMEQGVAWLEKNETDNDPQSIAMRLVLWTRLGRPRDEWMPLARRIRDRQRDDGGWSQTAEGSSDAWATGQALYALAHAGLPDMEDAISRGRSFLLKTQREDGSWPMASRPQRPGGEGADSLIPITGAGSAWAVLGLVRTGSFLKPGSAGIRAGETHHEETGSKDAGAPRTKS